MGVGQWNLTDFLALPTRASCRGETTQQEKDFVRRDAQLGVIRNETIDELFLTLVPLEAFTQACMLVTRWRWLWSDGDRGGGWRNGTDRG